MTEGSILLKLLQFSIPLICSSILQLLFNAADVVVVGRFAGDDALAAVGSVGSIINLLVNLFMGLSVGTNVVAGHFFGEKNTEQVQNTVHTSILIAFISGIVLTIVGVSLAKPILILMQSPENVLPLAALYLRIYFGGITASMIYNFGSALLRAKGDTKRPLYILMIAGIINVILNLIFVIVFKMSVAGVGLATIISQLFSAVVVIVLLMKDDDEFHLDIKKIRIHTAILVKIIKIGVPAGFQGIMFSFSNVIIQSSINSFGPVVVAGNSAASSLEGFVYISMNSLSQGCLTFCSQNMGAKRKDRIIKLLPYSQLSVIVIWSIECLIMLLFKRQLLSLYSTNPEVIDAGVHRLNVIVGTYFLCGIMDCMANTIRGCGHSLVPAIITIFGACVLRIVWLATAFQIPVMHTTTTIFLSYPISWIVTYIAQVVCFVVIFRKIK